MHLKSIDEKQFIRHGRKQKNMIQTIIDEMIKGNFSFAILVVGTAQLIVMLVNSRRNKS